MEVFSQSVALAAGQPMGGYSGERLSTQPSDELEVNGWCFTDSATGSVVELCTLDALYAGEVVKHLVSTTEQRLFLASHTHYAPMLDSSKPQLGALADGAVAAFANAIQSSPRRSVAPDICRVYRAEVPVPIYRRFDVPDSRLNRFLTSRAGMYPNSLQPIDQNLYLFEFSRGDNTEFVLAQHACHPVSRQDRQRLSPDYVGAIRRAVRERFGSAPCLFLQGCAGDIRPNLARKRVVWLPRSRFNWRFEWPVSRQGEQGTDRAYADAVYAASLWHSLPLGAGSVRIEHRVLTLEAQGPVDFPRLVIADRLRFDFVPFEVSHFFHLDAQLKDPMHFIVSCANHTLGYLPHASQLAAGGYEVDGSRNCMGMAQRAVLSGNVLW